MATIKEIMKRCGLGNTFRRMSPSALRTAIAEGHSAIDGNVRRGNCLVSVDVLQAILDEVESTPGSMPDGMSTSACPPQLAVDQGLTTPTLPPGTKRKLLNPGSRTTAEGGGSGIEAAAKKRKVVGAADEGKLKKQKEEKKQKQRAEKKQKLMTFLDRRIQDRMKGNKPINLVKPRNTIHEATLKHFDNKGYRLNLQKLSTESPTPKQLHDVEAARTFGPNYLGRTASLSFGTNFDMIKRPTNGHSNIDILLPAADTHNSQSLHDNLGDFTAGELQYMLGHHLIWTDLPSDEFLSYSNDPLFLVVHRWTGFMRGKAAIFQVPSAPIWAEMQKTKLHPRKFTQEYLSHHTIIVKDTRFQQASIEKLIKDGLYDIFPAFRVPQDHQRVGLYTGQVVLRKAGYAPNPDSLPPKLKRRIYSYRYSADTTPCTEDLLKLVQKVTRNFMARATEPHLHIFPSFLTFQKRLDDDPVLIDWLRNHYTALDVQDLYADGEGGVRTGFTHVANNLPGVMQYLDLVRTACTAFGLPALPPNKVHRSNPTTDHWYADEDAKQHRNHVSSKPYDRIIQQDARDKAKRKRKTKKESLWNVLRASHEVSSMRDRDLTTDKQMTVSGAGDDNVEDAAGVPVDAEENPKLLQYDDSSAHLDGYIDRSANEGPKQREMQFVAAAETPL
ncbi:hypothetical protein BAUCODRAFT_25913 [Baudoinia panamericana UAMH 10762]|uniref:Uncharacterized protein n=1 Tax=Baudoinia panamericana (strain UAMH 10762) TaxID=717646 RepID=M2MTD8_BAUPA|nr:uncharacterized protein BAUCODRAFT_25913 [Baudoinia panamericana UAMH 10762]EMC94798.1 hypothetical protein BAUCODRAFT_25913 [Baudoinia panamericana UAMH 10762]